ncbi:acetoacetate decarboxylase family protein [Hoyosella sp. YIM 151337]|uniref:acetoacetate decarboxylase family protein n=1 Tax=Hoyosella sp. YIM 151337 TaxID=2992742 RepID=UPI002235C419|nr:acetoacetate decarboxylase family protein [Hoyosella sp. YIM 151337]MCW4354692.1 acetoacetate decarboxylase family protein [Hoyosella sp. YIM 151337]
MTATEPQTRRDSATAMPVFAPLFTAGTESVTVRWLNLTYDIDADLAREILPSCLDVPPRPEAGLWLAEFIEAEFRGESGAIERRPNYMQGGVSIQCAKAGELGAYALETFVEGLNHGILGRELFGLPKKQAQHVRVDERSNRVEFAITTSDSTLLLEGTAHFAAAGPVDESVAPYWFEQHYTIKAIPSAEGNGFDISRLVRIPWQFSTQAPVSCGEAQLHWARTPSDPLYLLAPQSSIKARYGHGRLDIAYGTYLDEITHFPTFGTPSW